MAEHVVQSSRPIYQVHCVNHVLNLVNSRMTDNPFITSKQFVLVKACEVIKFAKISHVYGNFLKMLGFPKPRTHNKTRWWSSYLTSLYYLVVAKVLLELQNNNDSRKQKVELLTKDELNVLFDWVSSAQPCFDLNVELQQVCRFPKVESNFISRAT